MTIGIALTTLFTLGWIPLYAIRAESIDEALPEYGRRERVAVVLSAFIMSIHVALTCTWVVLSRSIPTWAGVLSAVVFLSGIGFWIWARTMIGPLRITRRPEETPRVLHRHGAFGVVRNPLYLGMLVAAGAPLIAAPRPYLGLTYVLCCLVLGVRALQDEARLIDQLGTPYEDYCREVKRLVPFLW